MTQNRGRLPLAPARLRRNNPPVEVEDTLAPLPVSAGPVEKALELAFNATWEKLREVTIINRLQGVLFPQLDMINTLRGYILEIAHYRQNSTAYVEMFDKPCPVSPNALDELLFRTAQWQKSIEGRNLGKLTEIAMAEMESHSESEEDIVGNKDPFKD